MDEVNGTIMIASTSDGREQADADGWTAENIGMARTQSGSEVWNWRITGTRTKTPQRP